MRPLFKHTAQLLSANVIAQAVGLLVYPLLSRMYSPEDFGVLNLFLSIGALLVLLATAEYPYSIVLPREERQARGLVRVCILCMSAVVALVVITIPLARPIAALFKAEGLARCWWLMPLYVMAAASWNILNYWYIRQSAFTRVSGYQVSQSLVSSGAKLGFGYAGFLQGGLIWSAVLAPLVSLGISVAAGWKSHLRLCFRGESADVADVARQYRNFPLFNLPRSLVNTLSCYLPALALTPVFGSAHVGLWSMAVSLGFTPVSMVTRALNQSVYGFVAERIHQGQRLLPFFRKFTFRLLAVCVPGLLLLYFVLPDLTAWLLGEQWRVSGQYIRWMLPWVCLTILTGAAGCLNDVFSQQKWGLVFEVALCLARVGGLLKGIAAGDFTLCIAGYCIGSVVVILPQYIWYMWLVRRYDSGLS